MLLTLDFSTSDWLLKLVTVVCWDGMTYLINVCLFGFKTSEYALLFRKQSAAATWWMWMCNCGAWYKPLHGHPYLNFLVSLLPPVFRMDVIPLQCTVGSTLWVGFFILSWGRGGFPGGEGGSGCDLVMGRDLMVLFSCGDRLDPCGGSLGLLWSRQHGRTRTGSCGWWACTFAWGSCSLVVWILPEWGSWCTVWRGTLDPGSFSWCLHSHVVWSWSLGEGLGLVFVFFCFFHLSLGAVSPLHYAELGDIQQGPGVAWQGEPLSKKCIF